MAKISIVVPFYNTKKEYLNECLYSLLNQSYTDLEILLVNDGSTVMYDNITDDRIKVINLKHQGVSNARNIGILNATGDYICFVDSDDMLCLNSCKLFNDVIGENDSDIILSRNYINNEEKLNYCPFDQDLDNIDKKILLKSIFIKDDKLFSSIDTPWAKLYKRKFLLDNNILFNTNLSNGEDGIFNYEAIVNADSIYFLNNPTYIYRENEYSVCKTFSYDLDIKFIKLIEEYKKLFKKYNIYDDNFNMFVLRILDRLLRKYYRYLSSDDFNCKLYEYYYYFQEYYVNNYNELVDCFFMKDTESIKKKIMK